MRGHMHGGEGEHANQGADRAEICEAMHHGARHARGGEAVGVNENGRKGTDGGRGTGGEGGGDRRGAKELQRGTRERGQRKETGSGDPASL